MVQVSYPGVYIQEKASGVRTITGVSTSIAAFLGRAGKGPINRPVRCLSLSDYVRTFGPPFPHGDLAASVAQFFNNGGTDCYVVRLAGAGAAPSEAVLESWGGVGVLAVRAAMAGDWGNGLRMEVDYDTQSPGDTFNLHVILEEGGREVHRETHASLSMDPSSPRFAPTFITQSSALIAAEIPGGLGLGSPAFAGFSEARRPLGGTAAEVRATLDGLINTGSPTTRRHSFDLSVDGSEYVTVSLADLTTVPAALADIASAIEDRANAALAGLVPPREVAVSVDQVAAADNQHFLRITAATAGADNGSVRVRRSSGHDLSAALLLGAQSGGVELGGWSPFRPAPTGSVLQIDDGTGSLTPLHELSGLEQAELATIAIGGEPAVSLAAVQTTGATDLFYEDGLPGDSPSGHLDGVREKLRIIAQAITGAPGSRYRADVHGYHLVIRAKSGTLNEIPSAVAFAGAGAATVNPNLLLNARQYALGTVGTSPFSSGGVSGQNGGTPGFADYVGDPVTKTGFHALDGVDLFNLMVLPEDHDMPASEREQIWGPASIYCRQRRAFLLVDPPADWTDAQGLPSIVQNTTRVDDLRATVVKDHSAVFYPDLRVNERGTIRSIGPSGAIAGLMARTDASRGVWKAPAGTEADLRGIAGIDVRLTDLENGVLNKLGVNCIRRFPSGFVNWGARTLDGSDDIGSEWKYIPIRRLALFIQESLYRGTQWVVFEPNDEPLWANIRLNVGVFMHQLFRQGAFQGSSPDQAYYVKCDGETTTQADRNLGIVNIEVGFAPLKPAEFVVITIQQIAGDLL